jgi:branched-chain amino acid aminotransferase
VCPEAFLTARDDAMADRSDTIWMDGKLVAWDDAKVHVMTHSLHYGLGAFEGIRCYKCDDGRSAIFRLDAHIRRLFDTCHIFRLKLPYTPEQVQEACKETIRANKLQACYIRPIVFIGDGVMGVHPGSNPIRLAIAVWSWGAYLGEEGLSLGIRCKISSFTRPFVNSAMTKSKSTGGYINSILAKMEVKSLEYDEAILLDTEGYVAEGSGENVYLVKNGKIKTPPLTAILPGITRDSLMRLAPDAGIPLEEQRFTRDELYIADEAFFTGTAAEITPIREVDDRAIGAGKMGPVTKKLQGIFFDVVYGRNPRYKEWLTYL